uniref:DNA-directed RNA polymerase subunit n=2 Tax=Cyclospora cayetanensis TaxID=88456 RepID=A0A193BMK0_9EIME|nr:RNA polymerase C1 [Cyclospora cayetanensis]ANN13288.1 RNA polymerase C1 [Cyclospora cayetanensis]ANN13317.1 RNA polymerase C1 [Cyclospora cayetanensis]ANN13346.1 RNA polymerase C1 [Cyclospora cayetanensis]ANN13375.1 RNA polymerase C1 [Cyclospora cayetanensis]
MFIKYMNNYNSLNNLKSNIGFKISIASPLNIIKWSWRKINNIIILGQISEPYTIDFKTGTPKLNGLFCEKIFGPLISWQCKCGIFKNIDPIKYTYICPICGYENTNSQVRRYRMGYIYLYTPVVHIWYLYELLPYILNLPVNMLEYLLYYTFFLEHNKKINFLKKITITQFIFASNYIQYLLQHFNILNKLLKIKSLLYNTNNLLKKKYIIKTINLLNLCLLNNIHPQWIMLDVIPVLPAGLRPLIYLNTINFVSSPLNEIYRTIIIINNKLKRWQMLRRKFPISFEIIEKRNLQQTIDMLIEKNNSKKNINSLSSHLQGKFNYFRQYILGKRIDFSGRSVIVSGPSLIFNKIGISTNLSIELFKPILLNILKKNKYINTLLRASYYIEYSPLILKRLLKYIFLKEIIMFNRAPTLHRMNIQTFKPFLIENEIIKLFPIACSGFNADFDGDQMGIFLILSDAAKKEAKKNIIFDKNLFAPSSKKNIFKYSQNIILGINTLVSFKGYNYKNLIFSNIEDILNAYNHSLIKINTIFLVRINFHFYFNKNIYKKYIITSLGRLLLQKLI